jgi:hypothetical protein
MVLASPVRSNFDQIQMERKARASIHRSLGVLTLIELGLWYGLGFGLVTQAEGDHGVTLDAATAAAATAAAVLHCRTQKLAQPIQAEPVRDPDFASTFAQGVPG